MKHYGVQFLFCRPHLAAFFLLMYFTKCSAENEKVPKLLIISFDGFRWDFLNRTPTPNFVKFLQSGVYATKGLENVFPTSTLTNHQSIVTGLYAESHGIIDNDMYDPVMNKSYIPLYKVKDKNYKNDKRFYDNNGVEPIWVTNKLQHPERRSASIMWWGAEDEVKGIKPFYHMPYAQENVDDVENIDKMVELFSSPTEPINLGLLYFGDPDTTAHKYGPDSVNVTEMIAKADVLLDYLLEEFDRVGLLDTINIIITSDHGFAPVSKKTLIHLDDFVDKNWYHAVHYNPILTAIPHKGKEEKVYKSLLRASKDHHFKVYKKEDIPERLHYKNNVRVTPIIAIADITYTFISNMSDDLFVLGGNHGYDPKYQEMRPFFMASGPAFKKNFTVDSFSLVDLYPMMCYLLDLTPAPNNGSLEVVKQLLIDGIPTPIRTDIYVEVFVILFSIGFILLMFVWRRRRYIRYRLKQITPEAFQGGVTIAWPVTYPRVTVTRASGPQMPLMMTYSDDSDDEF